jgi:hypothetical protein
VEAREISGSVKVREDVSAAGNAPKKRPPSPESDDGGLLSGAD